MRYPYRSPTFYRSRQRPPMQRPGYYSVFDQLNHEMNNMLGRFQDMFDEDDADGGNQWLNQWAHSPVVDFDHDEKAYHLSIELPGVKSEDLDVNVSNGTLTISGEKRSKRESVEGESAVRERSYGRFSRTLRLPEDVEEDSISASFEDGLLEIEIPRSAEKQPESRRIEVQSGAGGAARQIGPSDEGQSSDQTEGETRSNA